MSERQIPMNTGCRQVEDNLIDFVERKVPESLQRAIEGHLENCPECARLVERFSLVWEDLPKGERFTPPASLWPKLLDKIQSYDEPRLSGDRVFEGLMNSLRPAAIALLLIFGIFFGFHLGNIPERFPKAVQPNDVDPHLIEEIFVTEYLKDLQDFPLGSISDVYTLYEIQSLDEES